MTRAGDFGPFRELVERMQRARGFVSSPAPAAEWDQRPGEFEATRGLGERTAPMPAVVGARHDGSGWRVMLLLGGDVAAALDPQAARGLAAELADMADICEGKRW